MLRDILIYSSHEITSGTTAAIGVTPWFKFMTINCPSGRPVCFLQGLVGKLNEHVVGVTTLHLPGPWQRCWLLQCTRKVAFCLWLTFCLCSESSSISHLTIPALIAFTPQIKEPVWRPCQWLTVCVPIVHSRENNHRAGSWDRSELKFHLSRDFHKPLFWLALNLFLKS